MDPHNSKASLDPLQLSAAKYTAASYPIARRMVFYVPGFDPKGGSRYRALYRSEARRWTKMFGGEIKLAPVTQDKGDMRWRIEADLPPEPPLQADTQLVQTDYVVLQWDDLVEQRMAAPLLTRLGRAMRTFFTIIFDGSIVQMLRQALIPVVATLFPFLFVVAYIILAVLAGTGLTWLVSWIFSAPLIWVWPVGIFTAWLILNIAEALDGHTFALYLVDLYSYVHELSFNQATDLDQRIDRFAQRLVEASRTQTYDEILIVGHSGGGQLATSALARALQNDPNLSRRGAVVGLLTLGQFLTAQMQFADGERQRTEYKAVARSTEVSWVDVSALSDAVCYGLCDPLAERGGALPSTERRAGPKVISAAFKDTMSPESFAAIKNNHFRRHFQYLYAFEKPRAFDYFRITAGPVSLAARFRDVKTNHRAPPTAAELTEKAATEESLS